MTESSDLVFISYASPDQGRVSPFYDWLKAQGFDVWMDTRVKPGQNWDFEITRALEKATVVLVFNSEHSTKRRGYLQRELKFALDKRSEKLIDDIYIIPVLLDDEPLPEQLRDIQGIKASDSNCYRRIADAIEHQRQRLGLRSRQVQEEQQVYWTSSVKREEWDGIPGYEVELQLLEFRSDVYPNVTEISDYIRAQLFKALFEHRRHKFDQFPDVFNFGQDDFIRTSTYDAHSSEPSIVGKVLSVEYSVNWYGAGAAHPNYHFETFAFLLEPVSLIESLSEIFQTPDEALETIQKLVREELKAVKVTYDDEDEPGTLDEEWINEGTAGWGDFKCFVFDPDGIRIQFGAYAVAPYVMGPQLAKIPYSKIVALMRREYVSALELQFIEADTEN